MVPYMHNLKKEQLKQWRNSFSAHLWAAVAKLVSKGRQRKAFITQLFLKLTSVNMSNLYCRVWWASVTAMSGAVSPSSHLDMKAVNGLRTTTWVTPSLTTLTAVMSSHSGLYYWIMKNNPELMLVKKTWRFFIEYVMQNWYSRLFILKLKHLLSLKEILIRDDSIK